ncbi:MAG: hypothetical protein ABF586_00525 [Sporolactobacillus sp.]
MLIHTLGPEATDSYQAAAYYIEETACDGQICLHACFDEIINHLDNYRGDYLIIPAAFKSNQAHCDWADFHYTYLDRLTLVTCFRHPLDPLILIQRQNPVSSAAYTHPSTAALLERYLLETGERLAICYTDSKYLAYARYIDTKARYVLTNQRNSHLSPQEKVVRRYTPDMVWCLYKIQNENR